MPDLWAEDKDLSICCVVAAEFQHKNTDLLVKNNKIFNIKLILIRQVVDAELNLGKTMIMSESYSSALICVHCVLISFATQPDAHKLSTNQAEQTHKHHAQTVLSSGMKPPLVDPQRFLCGRNWGHKCQTNLTGSFSFE